MRVFDSLIDIANLSSRKQTIAVAGADHAATLRSIAQATGEGAVKPQLYGSRDKILQISEEIGLRVDPESIIETPDHGAACEEAVAAVTRGDADILMKGLVHTSEFARAVLNKSAGLIQPGVLISHLGLFELPYLPKPIFITDAAVNIVPDADKKRTIISNALTVMRKLGIEQPKVALIAPVEEVNAKIISTVDAAEISAVQRETRIFGDAVVEGPMAIDVALSEDAARIKGMDSLVAGDVDLLVCPNLDAANAVLKLFSFTPGSRSAGIMVGLKAPIVLNSRSDTAAVRYHSVKMAIKTAYC